MRFKIAALAALFAISITSLPACKKLMSVASAATPSPTTCWTVINFNPQNLPIGKQYTTQPNIPSNDYVATTGACPSGSPTAPPSTSPSVPTPTPGSTSTPAQCNGFIVLKTLSVGQILANFPTSIFKPITTSCSAFTGAPTPGPTSTATPTPTATPTHTPSPTPSPSGTPTATPSPTPSPSGTPTASPTPSPTPTASPTPTSTPSPTATPTASPSPTPTNTFGALYYDANADIGNTAMSTTTFSVTGAASNPYLRSDGTYFDIIVGTPGGGVSITASPGAILNGIRNGAAPATFTYYGIGSGSPTSYWTLDSSGQLAVEYKGPSATPTPTASPTPSPTPTATATPTPSPTPSPTPTGSSSATPTPSPTGTIAGLAPAAYYSYVTPVPTTLPSAMPTNPAYVQAFYGELQPYPLVTPNPFATTLTMTNPGSGADVYCELYPRNDGGATGYIDACVNSSTTTTETVAFHANQVVNYDSWDTQSNIDDSASGFCPSFTPLTYDDESFHNCAIVITEGANTTFTLSGANAMKPGAVRFFRLFNGTASSAASPTPVPVITPTASPTPVPVSFPGDFPPAYDQYVNALIAPVPTTTYYPFATTPTFHIGSTPANYESFQYTTSAGAVLLVPYFPQPSATPASFSINVTSTTPGTSMYLMSVTAFLPAPTASPCQYGQGLNLASSPSPTSTGSQTAYGMCAPAVLQIEAGPPTPNPSPTYSPYPGATASGCPTNIISAVGGPFPPWSRQCYFNQNIMNGILPANATPDPNDSPYMANSGVGNGPAPLTAVGTIFGSQASGYAINYVTNGSPSVPVNLSCTPGPCGTMSTSPIWLPTDFQMQGAPDCHTELAYPSLGYVEDMWQVNKYRTPICTSPVYQGAPFSSVTAARISMNSDGAHSTGATASTISPGIGTIKPWDVLDPRVSTFPTAIQIAPPCTNHFSRPPSWGSDAGVGSTCSGVLPPTGTFVYYKWSGASTNPAQGTIDTLNHILSCNLDILSQKYWMSMVPGWGHGLIITDTNGGGSSQFYVQSETDRDLTRFGVASAWQLVAKDMGISMNSNGTYSLPISYGTGGCIASSDVHFLSPNTPPITGAAAGIAVAP